MFLAAHRAPCRASQRGRQGHHHHHLPAADALSSLDRGTGRRRHGGGACVGWEPGRAPPGAHCAWKPPGEVPGAQIWTGQASGAGKGKVARAHTRRSWAARERRPAPRDLERRGGSGGLLDPSGVSHRCGVIVAGADPTASRSTHGAAVGCYSVSGLLAPSWRGARQLALSATVLTPSERRRGSWQHRPRRAWRRTVEGPHPTPRPSKAPPPDCLRRPRQTGWIRLSD